MAKKLVINCATCDTRKVTEEKLASFESVNINAAMILTNDRSRALLDRYPVKMNCAQVLDLGEDVQIGVVNGSTTIKGTDPLSDTKRCLIVNGSINIEAGSEKALSQYVDIIVNGSATYPESLSGCLGMMKVNGSAACYPDGAVVLKRNAVIDRTFALRAKQVLYWTKNRLIMVDDKLDAAALAAKGATFSGKEAIVAESKAEALAPLIDEKTDLIIVPDGTSVITDDVELDNGILKRYGGKLYIIGQLTVNDDAAQALAQVQWLTVRGDVKAAEALKDQLQQISGEITGKISVPFGGRQITDKGSARISKWMLEREEKGLLVSDCATVKLDADIPKELIVDRLRIEDCATVHCAAEQEDAVTAICQDVGVIETGEKGGLVQDILGMAGVGSLPEAASKLLDTSVINASEYVM